MKGKLKSIDAALASGRLYQALVLMRPLVLETNDFRLSDRLQSLERNYTYLIDYFASGHDDPMRTDLLVQMTAEGWLLRDALCALTDAPSPLWLTMRAKAAEYVPTDERFSRLRALFYQVWLQDYEGDPLALSSEEQEVFVSAIGLRLFERFSEKSFLVLFRVASASAGGARQRALVTLVMAFLCYDRRLTSFPALLTALQDLLQNEEIAGSLLRICNRLLETSLTPHVSRELESLQQDLIPQMGDGARNLIIAFDDEDSNPEWTAGMRDTVSRHMGEMTRLHQEGADFNYPTTKGVITDGFFHNDIANWFMPFSEDNPELSVGFQSESGRLLRGVLLANTEACDIDRYAMCVLYRRLQGRLADTIMPSVVKEMGTFEHSLHLPPVTDDALALGYLRGLYRFFYHNPWRYPNLMNRATHIGETRLFECCTSPAEQLAFGDRCLGLSLFAEAEMLFRKAVESGTAAGDPVVLQKFAFALQKQEKYKEAAKVFESALALRRDAWTLRHAAFCLHRMGWTERAVEYYEALCELEPEQRSGALSLAQCLVELERFDDALPVFYRLDILFPDDVTVQRGLGWCALWLGRFDVAEKYLEPLAYMADAVADDRMNYAHLLLLTEHREEAVQMYLSCLRAYEKLSDFLKAFRAETPLLLRKGVPAEVIALLEDTLLASSRPH